MKNNIVKLLFTFFISISLFISVTSAEAYYCKWVGGYYNKYGEYIPRHKVCYHHRHHYHCKWVGGHHNKNGHYIHKHKVCYY